MSDRARADTVNGLVHIFSLRGRASRREYAIVMTCCLAFGALAAATVASWHYSPAALPIVLANWLSLYLAVAVSVRRLHDLGKSGWLLLFFVIPMVGIVLIAWSLRRPPSATSRSPPEPAPKPS